MNTKETWLYLANRVKIALETKNQFMSNAFLCLELDALISSGRISVDTYHQLTDFISEQLQGGHHTINNLIGDLLGYSLNVEKSGFANEVRLLICLLMAEVGNEDLTIE